MAAAAYSAADGQDAHAGLLNVAAVTALGEVLHTAQGPVLIAENLHGCVAVLYDIMTSTATSRPTEGKPWQVVSALSVIMSHSQLTCGRLAGTAAASVAAATASGAARRAADASKRAQAAAAEAACAAASAARAMTAVKARVADDTDSVVAPSTPPSRISVELSDGTLSFLVFSFVTVFSWPSCLLDSMPTNQTARQTGHGFMFVSRWHSASSLSDIECQHAWCTGCASSLGVAV